MGEYLTKMKSAAYEAPAPRSEPPVVLELKFDRSFPLWMQELVERFDLDRGSFSKYGRIVDEMEMAPMFYAPTAHGSTLG
jgi:hypothetical protein